ncbi:MAG: class I SAM-dependent methyltransferase, partial [Betaproteobacteria bacterium]
VPDAKDHPALEPLRRRLDEEEAAYAAALAELDRLAAEALPAPAGPGLGQGFEELNALWPAAAVPAGAGPGAALRRLAFAVLQPALERQASFNASLVRLLNAQRAREGAAESGLRALASALVRYAQRVEPVVDARDRIRVAEAPTDAQLLLQAFDGRLDALQRRLDGLLALRDRVEVLSEELRALRGALGAASPPPAVAAAAQQAAQGAAYTAFENRFRGSRAEIRGRQADYAELFRDLAPVADLGCGRGEFLDALREQGIAACGVEGNANAVRECRERGLDVQQGDLVEFLRSRPDGGLGGVFAAQVVEHLPPAALQALLAESHRVLRPGGLLVLETVNAASALAFLDVFVRDLTHERPLHPDTLRFLAAAAGFAEARIEWRSPVPEDVRLHGAPSGGLPPPVARVFNENVARLNALLFAPLDYALVARR